MKQKINKIKITKTSQQKKKSEVKASPAVNLDAPRKKLTITKSKKVITIIPKGKK